ncbi:MAG TPA: GGDEF domain-containing protein [Rubrivivax sp.]|nr:GGDEF domain-containing protein [Rubrivivax sp.]
MAILRRVATAAGVSALRRLACWLGMLGALGALAAPPARAADCAPDAALPAAAQLLQLERDGRAQPQLCAARLAALAGSAEASRDERLEALLLQGWLLAGLSDHAGAEAAARALERAAESGSPPLAAAAALLVRARLAEQTGDTARAGELVDQAVARLPAQAGTLNRLRFTAAQSHIRNSASRLEDAIRLDHQALKLADELGVAWRQAEARSDLAYSYYQAEQLPPAHRLGAEALELARQSGDAITLAHVNTVQGIILGALGDSQAEREALQAALGYARQAGAKYEESLYLANLADYYLKHADYATALRHAQQALPLTRELKNLGGETVALANIGLAQIALGDIESGKRQLRSSIDIDERRGSITGVSSSHAEMAQYLERAGDYRGAIEAWHRHRALSAQILARDRQRAILEMQEQFDGERRARQLALLQREGQIKSEELHARRLEQWLWALLAAAGVLAALMAWSQVHRVRAGNRQLLRSNALLQQQSEVDPLTGLANRRHLQQAMSLLGAGGAGFQGSVLLADLDHFKRINDRHGHAAGDAVLVEVAQRLRRTLREADLIVRWGGEEFLVVVRALDTGAMQALAQRVLDAIGGAPCRHEGRAVPATVSIGYATFPLEPSRLALSWERALGLVDTAMYLAKAHGRNRAYGVRSVQAHDEQQLEAIGRALETAWLAGEVALTALNGPTVNPAAADAGAPAAAQVPAEAA